MGWFNHQLADIPPSSVTGMVSCQYLWLTHISADCYIHPYPFNFSKSIHLSPYPSTFLLWRGGQKQFLDLLSWCFFLFFLYQGKSLNHSPAFGRFCFNTLSIRIEQPCKSKNFFTATKRPQPVHETRIDMMLAFIQNLGVLGSVPVPWPGTLRCARGRESLSCRWGESSCRVED